MADIYKIDLNEVTSALNQYIDRADISVTKGDGENIYIRVKGSSMAMMKLHWDTSEDVDWEKRWTVFTYLRGYKMYTGDTFFASFISIAMKVNKFLRDWYDDNNEPYLDVSGALLDDVRERISSVLNEGVVDCEYSIGAYKNSDNRLEISIRSDYIISNEPTGTLEAEYYVEGDSICLVKFEADGNLMKHEKCITRIVKKCVKAKLVNA